MTIVVCEVLTGILNTPVVVINSNDRGRPELFGQDSQDTGSRPEINHSLAGKTDLPHLTDHHMCGGMMPSSKTHFRIDDDIMFNIRNRVMEIRPDADKII